MHRVYRIVHGGVVSHEVDNLIWVILCGFHVGGESASRTLLTRKIKPAIYQIPFAAKTCSDKKDDREFSLQWVKGCIHIFLLFITHSARSWVGNLPSVCHPLVVGPFLVGKRPIEDHTDVSHGVNAHSRAFEDGSGGGQEKKG